MTVKDQVNEIKSKKGPVPDGYDPKYVESLWYDWWIKEGFFQPEYNRKSIADSNPKGTFVMVIPPPNVTGTLHLGHALTNSIEDAIVRWNRMKGKTTVWVPGCDHAGIATQVVVEKKLWREEKQSRHDLGRQKFIEKVWTWKNEKGDFIYSQLRKLGSSLDWSRTSFTMDPKLCKAVNEAFIRLHEDGTIYRSNRLVNWSCTLKSAISDIEVDKKEITGRTYLQIPGYDNKVEFGVLVYFAYQLENSDEKLIVATTRIETMLGDVAIAVHPEDSRYKHLHGKHAIHPFIASRRLPVICDEFVDREFGSGVVKITPAHDANDYEVGRRHNLPFVTVINADGNMDENCGIFSGMKRFDCRRAVVEELKKLHLFIETKNNPMVIPLCSRSKDVIEPLIKPQWYVKCDSMAKRALQVVETGELTIIPEQHVKIWNHWMTGIKDWCISRQLWWGHQIPAYFVKFNTGLDKSIREEDRWVCGHSSEDARKKACVKFGVNEGDIVLVQDEDVLDTWFSSALFPFSVFGWPDSTIDLNTFYPTSMLETGHDILFFWVARMVFMGEKLLGKLPFKKVFLHPIVRDAHGRKMSKSLGNVIDPLDVINGISLDQLYNKLLEGNLDERELKKAKEGQKKDFPSGIPECGTDALRFALCAMCQGKDLNLDILRVQGYRFFCNKLWNATKFALIYLKDAFEIPKSLNENDLLGSESVMDRWILSRLSACVQLCNNGFETCNFPEVTTAIYNFWLYELCDVYLECLKPIFQSEVANGTVKQTAQITLFRCLNIGLRLLSPFMPYITEELYHLLPKTHLYNYKSICIAPYPDSETERWRDFTIEEQFEFILKIMKAIRSTRADYNLANKQKTEAFVNCIESKTSEVIERFLDHLKTLSYCSKIEIDNVEKRDGCAILTVSDKCKVHLVLKGVIDPVKECEKLAKKKDQLIKSKQKLETAISASDYRTKVPDQVQVNNSEKLTQFQNELDNISQALMMLKNI